MQIYGDSVARRVWVCARLALLSVQFSSCIVVWSAVYRFNVGQDGQYKTFAQMVQKPELTLRGALEVLEKKGVPLGAPVPSWTVHATAATASDAYIALAHVCARWSEDVHPSVMDYVEVECKYAGFLVKQVSCSVVVGWGGGGIPCLDLFSWGLH